MAINTAEKNPEEAWKLIKSNALQLRTNVSSDIAILAAENVTASFGLNIRNSLARSRAQLVALAATPGLDAYVQSLPGKSGYVASTEANNLITEIDQAIATIDGAINENTYTPTQTTGLRGDLQDIVDFITAA